MLEFVCSKMCLPLHQLQSSYTINLQSVVNYLHILQKSSILLWLLQESFLALTMGSKICCQQCFNCYKSVSIIVSLFFSTNCSKKHNLDSLYGKIYTNMDCKCNCAVRSPFKLLWNAKTVNLSALHSQIFTIVYFTASIFVSRQSKCKITVACWLCLIIPS